MSDYMKEMERLLDAHERTLILHERGAAWAEEPMSTRAALLAHAAQAERDAWGWTWQPIETAPTDGTRILLRGKDGKIADGHYGQPDGYANPKQFVWPYMVSGRRVAGARNTLRPARACSGDPSE